MIWLVLQPSWIFAIWIVLVVLGYNLYSFWEALMLSMKTENTLKEYLKYVPQNYQVINSTEPSQLWFHKENKFTKDRERTLQYTHYIADKCFSTFFLTQKLSSQEVLRSVGVGWPGKCFSYHPWSMVFEGGIDIATNFLMLITR